MQFSLVVKPEIHKVCQTWRLGLDGSMYRLVHFSKNFFFLNFDFY